MTARDWYDPAAGPWVGWIEDRVKHHRTGEMVWRRFYLWNLRGTGSTSPTDCVRFDTREEAAAAVTSARGPARRGLRRVGAEKYGKGHEWGWLGGGRVVHLRRRNSERTTCHRQIEPEQWRRDDGGDVTFCPGCLKRGGEMALVDPGGKVLM